ncbi:MAG: AMP-binding protein [Kiritimatiellae bacterium]|nr:AMP-binding protein [Kiritimatiellia bacterium]
MEKEVTARQLTELGLESAAAEAAAARVNALLQTMPAAECWREVSKTVLTPELPFDVHRLLYDTVFAGWDEAQGPRPAWTPTAEEAASSNIGRLMRELNVASYRDLHAWSVRDRGGFWERMIGRIGIRFQEPYTRALDLSAGVECPRWLVNAKLNVAESCFGGPPDAPAIVYQEEGGPLARMSHGALDRLSNRVAGALVARGYKPGDALACYLPMTAESVAIYLGIVKAGCVVVGIAESFAPDEAAKRLRLADARGIFTQDIIRRGGKSLPLYEKAVAAQAPPAIVLPAAGTVAVELREGDVDWRTFCTGSETFCAVPRGPDDLVNVLFSSGTTGDPKAIPWTQTTPIKCAVDGYLHHDIQPGDVVAWPTSLGWMMGPWLVFAGLVNRATVALYGGAPTGREFAQFVRDAGVTMLGVVPSLVKAWKERDTVRGLDWSAVKVFSSTGECSNAGDYLYLMSTAGYKPVIEYCGGTEIGGGYITGTVVQAASPATFSTPALGLDFVLLDEAGRAADNGEVFLVPPSIGLSDRLLNRDHHEVYFDGAPRGPSGETLRRHGDQIERLGGGYYRAHGRVDDTMNLGGIKVSSAEIERVVQRVESVRETAAIAVPPPGGGPDRLVIYIVPEGGARPDVATLKRAMQDAIKTRLNPLFRVHDVVLVESLPRTASNKVMRRNLRAAYVEQA